MTGRTDAAPMTETVTLTHPGGHRLFDVPARRARILVRQGWQHAGETSTPSHDDADHGAPDPSLED